MVSLTKKKVATETALLIKHKKKKKLCAEKKKFQELTNFIISSNLY